MKLELFTTFGAAWNETFHQMLSFSPDSGEENQVVNLYPELKYQTLEGFGGAVTDSAGYVYSQMDENSRAKLLEAYFRPGGMNYQMARVHLDSCDFSLEQYEAMSDPEDRELKSFSMERTGKYIIPMLRDAEKVSGKKLPLMLSPWSPPAFMKTNAARERGGGLKPEYRGLWAEYLCRYILEFQRLGFTVRRISLQNEPKAVQPWDSCIVTAREQKEFLRDFMHPAMRRHGLENVEVYLWDHNKERVYEWMRDILDAETGPMVAGAAFHWYSGDHFEALDMVRRAFPEKKLIVSESCIELYKFGGDNALGAAQSIAHELMGDLNHGMSAFYDWNLVLDETGGPNYVQNYCLAPYLYDTRSKTLLPQLIQKYMYHFCHYLWPGSVRIGLSRYCEAVEATAWQRPDGSIAVTLLNKAEKPMPVCLRMDGQLAELLLYPGSISTCVIS